nr:molybdopterin-dependent oxidoreductase [Kibdelosporangium sp. MJ126-NF4]CEL13434.1 Anaerobic dimethyl sulfoxide reductase chain A [Kibdelosporangium sp. MJ126-NF4]CTQ99123.1 Anaerobic dimethyl sulfoxide reductase chain A (EC 1.8.5.3) [Kibdelosporangium sp. MJ126-NF4]
MRSEVRGYCTLCRSRCGAIYTVEDGTMVGVRPDPDHPTGAAMCPKGRAAPEIVHSPRRLTTPLRRTTPKSDPDPKWEAIGWDEALDEIAARLGRIAAESGSEAVAFAVTSPSGTPLSDSIAWIERFVRLFGSPNICYSTENCNWHKDFAHAFTFGCGMPVPDFASTDLAVLWGHNPAKSWLAQSAALAEARANGAALAVVDPRRSAAAREAEHWLRVLPGTDAALALGVADQVLRSGGFDAGFVRAWSNAPLLVHADTGRFLQAGELEPGLAGYVVWDEQAASPRPYDTRYPAARPEDFALRGRRRIHTVSGTADCIPAFERYADACAAWPLERTSAVTGVDTTALVAFAEALTSAKAVSYYGWTGIGQHANATQTERAIATLYALTGSFDAPGGNVVLPRLPVKAVTAPDQLAPAQRAKALGLDEHPLGPPANGWISARALCRSILTGEPYRTRAMVGFGGNMLLSQPDPHRTAAALRDLEFFVHLDLFANPTADFADIVLPVTSPWEHDAVKAGFEITGRAQEHVQFRPRMVAPAGGARSDTEIVFDLASRLGMGADFFDGDLTAARDHVLAPLGLTTADLRAKPGGIRLPLETRHRKYTGIAKDGTVTGFATPTRRVELYSQRLADHGYPPVPEHTPRPDSDPRFPLLLTCAKNGYFCHSQHHGITSLRKRFPEPTAEIAADLADDRGIEDGQWVTISTRNGSARMRARIDPALGPRVVVAEYGWWQAAPDLGLPGSDPRQAGGANYNLLVDDTDHDPLSGAVPLRSTACDVHPVKDERWSGRREFVLTDITAETTDVRALRLSPAEGGPLPDFRPGQHITLTDGRGITRSYSLTGPAEPGDDAGYHVAVRRVDGGQFSTKVHHGLQEGDRVEVTAPGGPFVIPADIEFPVVLLAAGIGITPFLGYLETLAARGGTVPKVVLHQGNRDSTTHVFAARIRELAKRIDRLTVVDHYSRPSGADREHVVPGRIRAEHVDAELIRSRARFYLCGPETMLAELTAGLMARGVPRFDIFAEKFHAAPQSVDLPADAEADVHFGRSGRTLRWHRADGTLLDLAGRAGITLPSGCRVGQCESCAVPLLAGQVAHLIAPAEDLADNTCLTCQAVPLTDLTLDA